MKTTSKHAILLAVFLLAQVIHKSNAAEKGKRISRQTSADQMVQNILQWLQGVYTQNSRKIRQGTLREYLPPSNTQKPRPFQPQVTANPEGSGSNEFNNIIPGGYPPAGSITPQPPFPIYTSPVTGEVTGAGKYPELQPPVSRPDYGYTRPEKPQPPFTPEEASSTTPGYTPEYTPGSTTGYFPTGKPEGPSTGYTTSSTGAPEIVTSGYPSSTPGSTPGYTQKQETTTFAAPAPGVTGELSTSGPVTTTQAPAFTSEVFTSATSPKPAESSTISEETNLVVTEEPTQESIVVEEDQDKHPPHIHALDVQCAKDMMTINIEFNRVFDGIIYSKGFYNNPDCRYVKENTGETKYSFTVRLDSCGTEFINAFDTQGQSYLENVLVLQNEPGIQEVWDSIRAVRCLWEGNLNQALSVALSVDMLTQEIVTFSGDTAMAKLDIQMGRGPFAKPANGLVKIGELMTLVVSVSGDPGFDLQVKDCKAKDSTENNVVALTDENGCVLKPKLFGAFQKTRNTGSTGASIIAYAFFNAFKFPDVMDITLECNIELCKTDCEMCLEPNQKIEPGRRKRAVGNETLGDPVTMGKMLRVIFPEDINDQALLEVTNSKNTLCMSTSGFVAFSVGLVMLLTASFSFSAYMWLKNQRLLVQKL